MEADEEVEADEEEADKETKAGEEEALVDRLVDWPVDRHDPWPAA